MKYAIIIPDGAADEPLAELGGRTPLQAAHIPNMDWLAQHGQMGTARTVPQGMESGSDVATMSLLGYDPTVYHTGRAPLEAAALRIALAPTDWVFRCNLVTVIDGIMMDHSAGGITDAEARELLDVLRQDLQRQGTAPGVEFHFGVSYRNLLVYRGTVPLDVTTKPPHEIPNESAEPHWPKGAGSDLLNGIMRRSMELFAEHPVNRSRRSRGLRPATQVWLWGQGHAPSMPSFASRFGITRACMVTSVDLLRGLGVLMGWDVKQAEGMTSFHDTNYAGQGAETAALLDEYDLVLSHVEAPDEASHQADWKTKVASIEQIDRHIVAPVLRKLQTFPEWRLMVLPDHPTNIATRRHGSAPTCFAIAGTGMRATHAGPYCENTAANGVHLDRGHDLMEYFLRGKN